MIDDMPPSFRLPTGDEQGVPFDEWLLGHEQNRPVRNRVKIFVSQWDHLRDHLEREPTVREYAREWRVPEAIAYREAAEVRRVLGVDAGEVADVLWEGIRQQQGTPFGLMPFYAVRVVSA